MAKGSLSGVRKGKKGDSVYYKIAASNNKDKQGERQYIGAVTNPKTDAQVEQRMKMTPAVNLYRALKDDVLDHSFQGVKYGARSHSEFMKMAMQKALNQLPYVSKGETDIIPAPYIISKGGLPDIGVIGMQDQSFVCGLGLNFEVPEASPYKDYVDTILWANPGLKRGDQLTAVCVYRYNGFNQVKVTRLILDETKYQAGVRWGLIMAEQGLELTSDGVFVQVPSGAEKIAGALILSRPVLSKSSGSVSWNRSTTSLWVMPEYLQSWQTEEKLNAAIASYKSNAANPTSDWYLNDGTLG